MEWDNFPPPSQLPALIAQEGPQPQPRSDGVDQPLRRVQHRVTEHQRGARRTSRCARPCPRRSTARTSSRCSGGPKLNPPLSHVLPSVIVGGEKNFDLYPYDATKAKSDLAAAGYPNGLTLKMLYRNASQGSSKTFQTVQQDLSKIGVTVVGVPSPNADFYTKYLQVPTVARRGVWDLARGRVGRRLVRQRGPVVLQPALLRQGGLPAESAATSVSTTTRRPTPLIEQAALGQDEGRGGDLWAQADQQVMKDAPFFPITNPSPGQLPGHPGAERGLRARRPELRPGERLAERRQAGRLSGTGALPPCPSSRSVTSASPSTPPTGSSGGRARALLRRRPWRDPRHRRRVRLGQERGDADHHRPDDAAPGSPGRRASTASSCIGASPEVLRGIRGARIGMIFQDPLSSLHPYYTRRLADRRDDPRPRPRRVEGRCAGDAPPSCSPWSGSRTPRAGSTTTRTSSPAGCVSGS